MLPDSSQVMTNLNGNTEHLQIKEWLTTVEDLKVPNWQCNGTVRKHVVVYNVHNNYHIVSGNR